MPADCDGGAPEDLTGAGIVQVVEAQAQGIDAGAVGQLVEEALDGEHVGEAAQRAQRGGAVR